MILQTPTAFHWCRKTRALGFSVRIPIATHAHISLTVLFSRTPHSTHVSHIPALSEQCTYITLGQRPSVHSNNIGHPAITVQFSLVFYCIYSYMFWPHYLAIFRLSVNRCSYIVPLYYIIYYTYNYITTIYCHTRSLIFVHCWYKYV
jgi:hypothetical protein